MITQKARLSLRSKVSTRPGDGQSGTQGFQYGSALLQFDATGDEQFLE